MTDINGGPSDREKFDVDREFRHREIALKELELDLRAKEASRLWWNSSLVLAVAAAALGLLGNALVAYLNISRETALEETKAESSRILEMIKTGNGALAVSNLKFLLDAGLILNEDLRTRMTAFLENVGKDDLPVLPISVRTGDAPSFRQQYLVFVQFAGSITRENIRAMMLSLESKGWSVQGSAGGGERTSAATGILEIRHGSGGVEAAKLLAEEISATTGNRFVLAPVLNSQIPVDHLEVWMSN